MQSKRDKLPDGIKYYYYHSFQDSLWDLIQNKVNKRHLHFLVPDFYCSNVLDNLKKHGHRYIYYPLDNNFQIKDSSFKDYLWLFKPDVVIIFHAAGITSNLFKNTTWLSLLSPNSLIIEDAAHRLVDPQEIKLINDRHFIIDSLRKVTFIPGSRLFGSSTGLNFNQAKGSFTSQYFLKSSCYYLLYILFNRIGFLLSSESLQNWAYNTFLKKHDLLVGCNYSPQPELPLFKFFIDRLNYKKIRSVVKEQIQYYRKKMKTEVNISSTDESKLCAYPLVTSKPRAANKPDYIYKFTDTPWSHRYQAIFYPIGNHLNLKRLDAFLSKSNATK